MISHVGRVQYILAVRWPKFAREMKIGMYSPVAYFVVGTVLAIPINFVVVLFLMIPVYVIADLNLSTFWQLWVLSGLTSACFDAWAEFAGFFGAGGEFIMALYVLQSSFGAGVYLNGPSIIWPFRCFYYILPSRWCFAGWISIALRESRDFHGAVVATNGTLDGQAALTRGDGFYCPTSSETTTCYGITGRDVTAALQVTKPSPRALACALSPAPSALNADGLPHGTSLSRLASDLPYMEGHRVDCF